VAKSSATGRIFAARFLKSNPAFRISVNTLQGTTSFWDEVRAGIADEAHSLPSKMWSWNSAPILAGRRRRRGVRGGTRGKRGRNHNLPTRPQSLLQWMRRAPKSTVPVFALATDAPGSEACSRLVDTMVSGSLAADLLGKFLQGSGKVAVTLSAMGIQEHAEKCHAFESTLRSLYLGCAWWKRSKLRVGDVQACQIRMELEDSGTCHRLRLYVVLSIVSPGAHPRIEGS